MYGHHIHQQAPLPPPPPTVSQGWLIGPGRQYHECLLSNYVKALVFAMLPPALKSCFWGPTWYHHWREHWKTLLTRRLVWTCACASMSSVVSSWHRMGPPWFGRASCWPSFSCEGCWWFAGVASSARPAGALCAMALGGPPKPAETHLEDYILWMGQAACRYRRGWPFRFKIWAWHQNSGKPAEALLSLTRLEVMNDTYQTVYKIYLRKLASRGKEATALKKLLDALNVENDDQVPSLLARLRAVDILRKPIWVASESADPSLVAALRAAQDVILLLRFRVFSVKRNAWDDHTLLLQLAASLWRILLQSNLTRRSQFLLRKFGDDPRVLGWQHLWCLPCIYVILQYPLRLSMLARLLIFDAGLWSICFASLVLTVWRSNLFIRLFGVAVIVVRGALPLCVFWCCSQFGSRVLTGWKAHCWMPALSSRREPEPAESVQWCTVFCGRKTFRGWIRLFDSKRVVSRLQVCANLLPKMSALESFTFPSQKSGVNVLKRLPLALRSVLFWFLEMFPCESCLISIPRILDVGVVPAQFSTCLRLRAGTCWAIFFTKRSSVELDETPTNTLLWRYWRVCVTIHVTIRFRHQVSTWIFGVMHLDPITAASSCRPSVLMYQIINTNFIPSVQSGSIFSLPWAENNVAVPIPTKNR